MLIVWQVDTGKALYGTPMRDVVSQIKFFNKDQDKLIAVLDKGVQILTIDKVNKKVYILFLNNRSNNQMPISVISKEILHQLQQILMINSVMWGQEQVMYLKLIQKEQFSRDWDLLKNFFKWVLEHQGFYLMEI